MSQSSHAIVSKNVLAIRGGSSNRLTGHLSKKNWGMRFVLYHQKAKTITDLSNISLQPSSYEECIPGWSEDFEGVN